MRDDYYGTPDYRFCGGCACFEPKWTMGFAGHGRIYKSKLREGHCGKHGIAVRERNIDEMGCWEPEGGHVETVFEAEVERALDRMADEREQCAGCASFTLEHSHFGRCTALNCHVRDNVPFECGAFERRP